MPKAIDSQKNETGGVLSAYQLLTLYFPAFVLALGYSIATPAIPVFAKSFDTGFGVASLVIVVHALGGLVAAVPTGFLVDHLGRRPMLFAGPILMAASSFLTATAQAFPELLLYRFLGGAAMEMWRQARLAIIADVSKSRQRGRQMSGMVGTEGAGKLLGPAVGGILAVWSIRMPFVVHGALAFLAIVPSFFLGSRVGARQKQGGYQKQRGSAHYSGAAGDDARCQVSGLFRRAVFRIDDSGSAVGRDAAPIPNLRL